MSGQYQDIIDLSHHVSQTRARMSMSDRAAQFSPFAALTGFDAAVEEAGRLTDRPVELDVDAQRDLDEKLCWIRDHLDEGPVAAVTHFVPDERKSGGAYVTTAGPVRRIDGTGKWLLIGEGEQIFFDKLLSIQGGFPEKTEEA